MNRPITEFHDKEGARLSRWAIRAGMLITDVTYDAVSGRMDVVTKPAGVEWRVVTFYGSIHMATYPAKDEEDARRYADESTYQAVIQRRQVEEWADA